MASMYSPFRGCRKCSEGCLHCYIHKKDAKRNVDTSKIVRTSSFYKPIERKKNGEYKMKPGLCYLCFQSDFLIEEADEWRKEAFKIIKEIYIVPRKGFWLYYRNTACKHVWFYNTESCMY